MPPKRSNDPATILKVARGEEPWTVLGAFGITISFDDEGKCRVEGKETVGTKPLLADVASGFLKFRGHPDELRRWASVVLMAPVFDLENLQDHATGEMFLESLWDAAYGDPVSEETFAAASKVEGEGF